jgi:hypothetical protein
MFSKPRRDYSRRILRPTAYRFLIPPPIAGTDTFLNAGRPVWVSESRDSLDGAEVTVRAIADYIQRHRLEPRYSAWLFELDEQAEWDKNAVGNRNNSESERIKRLEKSVRDSVRGAAASCQSDGSAMSGNSTPDGR